MEEIDDSEQEEKSSQVDDVHRVKEIKKAFKEHQIPSFIFFGGTSALGIGLFFVGSWAVLLGCAFLIPSVFAILSAILCMNPTGIRVYVAKICRNVAWILLGALLIAFGLMSCVGYLGFAFIGFGVLSVLRGILKAMVGSTTDVINIQRQIVRLDGLGLKSREELHQVTYAESKLAEGGVYNLKAEDYAGKRRKFLSYMIFSIFTSVATGVLVVILPLPLVVTLVFCGMATVNLVASVLRICFIKKQEEHVKHFQRASKTGNLFWSLIAGLLLLILLVLPFGPLVPAFVGLVKFLGVSSVLLRVFLVAFILCVLVTIVSIQGGKYENIKFQLAFREIEYGRHKTKLPEFMKEYFDTPKLMMSDTNQGATINVEDMNNCFGKVDVSS